MKYLHFHAFFHPFLLLCLCALQLEAQVSLSGTIVTPQGKAVSGAQISIFEAGTRLTVCTADASGKFTSESILKRGQKIKAEITAEGFQSITKDYTIQTGKAGNIVLTPSKTTAPTPPKPSVSKGLRIKGRIKSDQNTYIKDVLVHFYYDGQTELTDSDETLADGTYQSADKFKNGDVVEVVVQKNGFAEQRKTITFSGGKDITVDFTLTTRTFIAGYVVNSRGEAIQGVQISYRSKEGPYISVQKTNSKGYYEFDVPQPFIPGNTIAIRAEKDQYKPVNKEHTILLAENQVNFVQKLWTEEGMKLSMLLHNKNGKTLSGVSVSHFDSDSNRLITKVTPPNNLPLVQTFAVEPGKSIEFTITKRGYKEQIYTHRFGGEGFESKILTLENSRSNARYWLFSAIGLGAVSGTGYGLYQGTYKDYTTADAANREDTYKKATTQLRIGTIAGGLAIGALTGWIVCKIKENRRTRSKTGG